MNDLRKAAEMALKQLHRDDWYLGHRSKTRADAITALQQALDDEPPVKTYCGGKPNYCTPEETPEVTPEVDVVNMTQDRVDETAKGEHEPVGFFSINDYGNWEQNENGYGTPFYTAPPKKEWVGLTDEDYDKLLKGDWGGSLIQRVEAKLREKNS